MRKQKALKISSLLILFLWTASLMSTAFAAPDTTEEAGGPITDYVVTKIADESIELIDGWVVSGLDYAADKTGINLFSTMGDLLTLPSGKDTSEILKLCQEMKSELDAMQSEMDAISDKLDSLVGNLEKMINQDIWYNNRREYSAMMDKYKSAYMDYTNYLDASEKYTEAVADGDADAMESEKHEMNGYLINFTENFDPTKTGDPISFKSDLRQMAKYACRYYPSYDRSNPNPVLSPTNSITLLDNAKSVTDQTVAFEHQQYDVLEQQINDCIRSFTYMTMVNRIWMEYNISANVDDNTKDKLLTEQETVLNEAVQAINDITAQGKAYTDHLMRSYDAEIDLALNYSGSSTQHMKGKEAWPSIGTQPYDIYLTSDWTKPEMPAYQFKALGSSIPFVLLKENGNYLTHDKLFDFHEACIVHAYSHQKDFYDYSTMSQDFLNIAVSSDYNYIGITSASTLKNLVNTQAYRLMGSNNIVNYLTGYGGVKAEDLPANVNNAVINKWDSAADRISAEPGLRLKGSWCCTYYYIDDLTNYRLDDTNSKIDNRIKSVLTSPEHYNRKLNGVPLLVLMQGQSLTRFSADTDAAAGTLIQFSDENGNALNQNYTTGAQIITLTVDASGLGTDKHVESVDLVNSKGEVLDTLLTADDFNYFKNEDDTVRFHFTAPYQKYTVRTTVGNQPDTSETVTDSRGSMIIQEDQTGIKELVPSDIYTFEDLKRVARAVFEEPETYAHANFNVMADINAGGQAWPLPIGTDAHPYTGTFNGKGHTVSGMNVDNGTGSQGLFGHLGKTAVVKALRISDTDINTAGSFAGVIAGINEGRIENCHTGSGHLLTDSADLPELDDMNVHITSGQTAGGIAGKNSGIIASCSSSGQIKAQTAGGLTGENSGVIRNGFGAALAKIEGQRYSGGITGMNTGELSNLYFGGSTEGGADGAVAGKNDSGAVDACYYDNTLDQPAGEGALDASAVSLNEMKQDHFKDLLNQKVGMEDSYWQRNDNLNLGFPYLSEDVYYAQHLEDPDTGIQVSGDRIHVAAALDVQEIDQSSSAYQEMTAKNKDLLGAYDISLQTPGGAEAFEGSLDIAFPGDFGKNGKISILHDRDGSCEVYNAVKKEDGLYHITVDHLSAFGIAVRSGITIFQWVGMLCLLALLGAGFAVCAAVHCKRRKSTTK